MSTPIPPPLRAVAGLAAVAIDSARKLPEQLVGLPVLAVSAALQVSLKAQQRYAELVARGDEVLGQLRGAEEAPAWARFDDEPAGARPRSAFDAAPEPGPTGGGLLDELAADELGSGEPEVDLLADAAAGLDGGPVPRPDGVLATEAEVGGLDLTELGVAELAAAAAATAAGREPGSVTEPGVDLATAGVGGLGSDAEAVEDALAAAEAAGGGAGDEDPLAGADTDGAPADPVAGLDGYLAVDPPIPHYDELSIPQLRGRLRSLSEAQLAELVAYERATAARPPYLTMLENRLATVRSR